jgi:hypothetical protein
MSEDKDIFERVGQRTPYTVPDGFFEEMQHSVLRRVNRRRALRRRLWTLGSTAAAAVTIGVVFLISGRHATTQSTERACTATCAQSSAKQSGDEWIHELSDDDLESMISTSEQDVFLDNN